MHVLRTGVPRCLGVARSASSPKAAQALGCSLTPGLRISFGRVTCMARAASVPGLWTLGFLLLCGACVGVWVVLGFWIRMRPATPGWVVGVCVRLRARSACTQPLLAGVCSVGVSAWARVSAAPRQSWLGCWDLCVLVCPLRLYPATPGWGVRCACVCSGSVFGCAPPLLAGVLRCVCACVCIPLVPRHSWLGCAVWVCVLGLGFRLRPTARGLGVGVCVLVCALRLYPATPGWAVRAWARVLAAPRRSWLGCWCVGVCVRAPPVPRHSWLGCAVSLCVLGLGFRLRPATPGWGVGVLCVFVCALRLYPATPGWGVRALARVSAAPRHSWLGCWGVPVCVRAPPVPRHSWLGCAVSVCVLGLGFRLRPATPGWGVGALCVFSCVLRLYPATPGWGVRCGCGCLGLGFGCAPPLLAGMCGVGVGAWARISAAPRHSWLGCWGVRACVRAPLVPRHSWRGCASLGLGFGCAPPLLAGVLGCACLCAGSACTPPLLARVCGVGVRARARVSAAPGHSWLGCWGFCVFVCALRLYAATAGWGVRCGRVWLASGFGCAPPLLAGVCGVGVCAWARVSAAPRHSWLGCWGYCVFVCASRSYPATPGWGVRFGCVCLGSGFGCAPPLLAAGLGCACLCARSACTPPLLAGVRALGVCVLTFVLTLVIDSDPKLETKNLVSMANFNSVFAIVTLH